MRYHTRNPLSSTVLMMALSSGVAQASGQLPPVPLAGEHFADFAACKSRLDQYHAKDIELAQSPVEQVEKDRTVKWVITTQGVIVTAPDQAEYQVTQGREFRSINYEIKKIVTSYSYETLYWQCSGAELSGQSVSGYALPGYENLPEQDMKKPD
jgi:hypothetical protein